MVGVSPCTELICRQYGVDRVCGSQYSVEPFAGGVHDAIIENITVLVGQ